MGLRACSQSQVRPIRLLGYPPPATQVHDRGDSLSFVRTTAPRASPWRCRNRRAFRPGRVGPEGPLVPSSGSIRQPVSRSPSDTTHGQSVRWYQRHKCPASLPIPRKVPDCTPTTVPTSPMAGPANDHAFDQVTQVASRSDRVLVPLDIPLKSTYTKRYVSMFY